MKRTLNFGNRADIDKGLIKIVSEEHILDDNSMGRIIYPVITSVSVRSSNYPSDSKLVLKLKYLNLSETIECGTISNPRPPEPTALKDWNGVSINLTGSISIVDPDTDRIIGSNKGRISIFKTKDLQNAPSPFNFIQADTSPFIWKLDSNISELDEFLTLYISSDIVYMALFKTNPIYLSLILPAAFRQALGFMVDKNLLEEDDSIGWPNLFIRFIKETLRIEIPSDITTESGFIDYDNKERFINDVVDKWLELPITQNEFFEKSISMLNEAREN